MTKTDLCDILFQIFIKEKFVENKLDRDSFSNREEYEKALKEEIKKLDTLGEFEISLHQVGPSFVPNDDSRRIAGTRETMLRIMREGLEIDGYGSLGGTAMKIGSNYDYNIRDIVEYSYYDRGRDNVDKGVCIIAIPKYITVDGKKVKFSYAPEERNRAADKFNAKHRFSSLKGEHMVNSLFDCVKRDKIQSYDEEGKEVKVNYGYLPKEFMLCFQEIIAEDSSYRLINPQSHLVYASDAHKKAFAAELERIVKECFKKYQTDNIEEILFKVMEEDEAFWEERERMDESGW